MTQHGDMDCPICSVPLVMSDRQGIEIDYCPKCRGVWLDRGELDKIIERSVAHAVPSRGAARPEPSYAQHGGQGHSGFGHGHYGKPHKKQKHWLSEIFD